MNFDPRTLEHDVHRREPTHRDESMSEPRDARNQAEPSEVFVRGLDVPRDRERHLLFDRGRSYHLRESEVRALATIGAFRVIHAGDLRNARGAPMSLDRGDLRELRRAGLIKTVTPRVHRNRTALVTLSSRGRALLEAHRHPNDRHQQTFYAGIARSRELTHDAQIYRAYLETAERLKTDGANVLGVRLDHELKRDYQRFLQEPNRGRSDSDGRPRRDADEIRAWADANDLPYFDERVHFPDLRVEYELPDGRRAVEDLEVRTPHYRGAHAAGKARAGFAPFDPDFAQEFV